MLPRSGRARAEHGGGGAGEPQGRGPEGRGPGLPSRGCGWRVHRQQRPPPGEGGRSVGAPAPSRSRGRRWGWKAPPHPTYPPPFCVWGGGRAQSSWSTSRSYQILCPPPLGGGRALGRTPQAATAAANAMQRRPAPRRAGGHPSPQSIHGDGCLGVESRRGRRSIHGGTLRNSTQLISGGLKNDAQLIHENYWPAKRVCMRVCAMGPDRRTAGPQGSPSVTDQRPEVSTAMQSRLLSHPPP